MASVALVSAMVRPIGSTHRPGILHLLLSSRHVSFGSLVFESFNSASAPYRAAGDRRLTKHGRMVRCGWVALYAGNRQRCGRELILKKSPDATRVSCVLPRTPDCAVSAVHPPQEGVWDVAPRQDVEHCCQSSDHQASRRLVAAASFVCWHESPQQCKLETADARRGRLAVGDFGTDKLEGPIPTGTKDRR